MPAQAQYGGGTGEPNDPYQIATPGDLMLLGDSPDDYDKHFILTADIDLDPNLPGRRVFDRAVIAPDTNDLEGGYQGVPFTGVFDGSRHAIPHLTIEGESYLGLFGRLDDGAKVSNVNMEAVDVDGTGDHVGGLVGYNRGKGTISNCYSTGTVSGNERVGGLVGGNHGTITNCCSAGTVCGVSDVGGLAGWNYGTVSNCYSTGTVSGNERVGGLVGGNGGSITTSYSTGMVTGNEDVGGLVGSGGGVVLHSVWDMESSGLSGSAHGVGLTTAEMMDPDILGLNGFARDRNWVLDAGRDYPRLAWEGTAGQIIPEPIIDWFDGQGTDQEPYRIDTADQLILLSRAGVLWDKHFILGADINLDPNLPGRRVFSQAVIQGFSGVFDGNGHVISHLTIVGGSYLGLFGQTGSEAVVFDLGLQEVEVNGTGGNVGGLVGNNHHGNISNSYSTGTVSGENKVGGLLGYNYRGTITTSYSTGTVTGNYYVGGLVGCGVTGNITGSYSTSSVTGNENVGGLVGWNVEVGSVSNSCSTGTVSGIHNVGGLVGFNQYVGSVYASYSTATVTGHNNVGGLVGNNVQSQVSKSYSTGTVTGESSVGGLVGHNGRSGIRNSYSTGTVSGNKDVGGLVGNHRTGDTFTSFWDVETSGQSSSAGGVGLTTAEMMDPYMLGLNGFANDPNWVLDAGRDYPRLAWEGTPGQIIPEPIIDWLDGQGTDQEPYRIDIADQLILLSRAGVLWDKHFILGADINLDPNLPGRQVFSRAVIPVFSGVFDGNGHTISHLTIRSGNHNCLGLFGKTGKISNLGLEAVDVNGTSYVGGLVGFSSSSISNCHSTGSITGIDYVGGLVGYYASGISGGSISNISNCHSTGSITGIDHVGGLVGHNSGSIVASYSVGTVSGEIDVGGFVGNNNGSITMSYSTGSVIGYEDVGGLVGRNYKGSITSSFWDMETSGQTTSAGGLGLTTVEMQTASTFLEAGWDFEDETANGTEDIWWILEGQDYPRLSWEGLE